MGVTLKSSKDNFFDKKIVIDAIGKSRAAILNESGRRVRSRAQSSLRYVDSKVGPAPAGSPPYARTSRKFTRVSKSTGRVRVRSVSFLREFLWYKYDPATGSVVVGPERLNSTVNPLALPALEYGGQSSAVTFQRGKRREVPIRVAAHPFMGPAFEAVKPGLADLWRDSL